MTLTNCYMTLDEFKLYLFPGGNAGTTEDAQMEAAITAACRAIDAYCGRRFYVDASVSARYYTPTGNCVYVDDFSTTTGLLVSTDDYDNGSFSTTWTKDTDFRVAPVNGERMGISGWPYTELVGMGTRLWPSGGNHGPRVSVTAKWGWAAVPDAVKQAAFIKAARIYRRAKTPEGFAGGEQFGVIRVSSREDPDAAMLLGPFRKAGGSGLVIA